MKRVLATAVILLGACGHPPTRKEFYGIDVEIPDGTSWAKSGTESPESYEGASTDVTPGINFIHPHTNDFYVDIQKLPHPLSLEGMKHSLAQQPTVKAILGRVTAAGWDVEYSWHQDDGTTTTVFVRYLQLANDQYQCQYDAAGSKKLELAESICRSMRAISRK